MTKDSSKDFPDGSFKTYRDSEGNSCGKWGATSITRSCFVEKGGYLGFNNKEDHIVYITLKMYNKNPGKSPDMQWDPDAFTYSDAYLDKVLYLFH